MSSIISTPRFGGCRDVGSGEILRCVLSPNDCPPPLLYTMPHLVERNQCSSASQVSLGRCSSSVDNKICAPSMESCAIGARFVEDAFCSAIQDTAVYDLADVGDVATGYGTCRSQQVIRCVVSPDHCEAGETFKYIKEFVWEDVCPCRFVPTGLCFLPGIRSADASFCALDARDCPPKYSWISATDLLLKNIQNDPSGNPSGDAPLTLTKTCRLCPPFVPAPNTNLTTSTSAFAVVLPHEKVVEAGGCLDDNGNFTTRALEAKDCPNKTDFRSSHDLRRNEGLVPTFVDDMPTGRCASTIDDLKCTGNKSGCQVQDKFVPIDNCTVRSDLNTPISTIPTPTLYGMCRENAAAGGNWRMSRCVWQESECNDPFEIFWHAREGNDQYIEECSCDQVQTGGCAHSDGPDISYEYSCAVSADGCSDPSQYRSSLQLSALGVNCRLCHPQTDQTITTPYPTTQGHGAIMKGGSTVIAPTPVVAPTPVITPSPPTTPIVVQPTATPPVVTSRPTAPKITSSDAAVASSPSNTNQKTLVIAVPIACVVGSALVGLAAFFIARRGKRERASGRGQLGEDGDADDTSGRRAREIL